MYNELTSCNEVLDEVADTFTGKPETLSKIIEKELEMIKYKSFGKVKFKKRCVEDEKLSELQARKCSLLAEENTEVNTIKRQLIDEEIASALMTKQSNALQQKVSLLHDIKAKKGKMAALFKLKEGVVGPKSAQTEAVSLLDPESGCEITSAVGIKKASLDYCTKLLTNRAPKDGYVEVTEHKQLLHLRRMKDRTVHESDILTEESFNYTYNRLAKKPGHKMDFIMKAGNSLKPALYQLCKRIWDEEKIPDSWNKSTLVQLYKGSGPKNRLENQRFIHMKGEFSKFFGNLLMDSAKASIFENMSPFQIGTKPGHRAQEHLFVVKSAMALQNKFDMAPIISFWDIKKFFLILKV